MLEIKDLHAKAEDDLDILKGVSLSIKPGEIHAVMGPNGSGKSTLSKVICGHPGYEITQGTIIFDGKDIAEMDLEDRAHLGLFLAFQYPEEIPGVNNASFLRMAYNAHMRAQEKDELDPLEFEEILSKKSSQLELDEKYLDRSVNVGFSGGEKKRNEMLQMLLLDPKLAILDETDSGLDIDALRIVANAVNQQKRPDNAFLVITHYQRLLDYIVPDIVHVIADGKIIKTGDKTLALKLEEQGYDWLLNPAAV